MQFIMLPSRLVTEVSLEVYKDITDYRGGGEVLRISDIFFSLWVNILLIVQKLCLVGLDLKQNEYPDRFELELFPSQESPLQCLFHWETIVVILEFSLI